MINLTRSILLFILAVLFMPVPPDLMFGQKSGPAGTSIQVQASSIENDVFPDNYPEILREVWQLLEQSNMLKTLAPADQEAKLVELPEDLEIAFRGLLKNKSFDVTDIWDIARAKVGQAAFDEFLDRFGIESNNEADIELEVQAQIQRMHRRKALHNFIDKFSNPDTSVALRIGMVRATAEPLELEYALRNCREEEFETLLQIVAGKTGFGPRTPQDRRLFEHLVSSRKSALKREEKEVASNWAAVIAQLVSQPLGRKESNLYFSNDELFAMMRNAERTIEQRKSSYIEITRLIRLERESESFAREIINRLGKQSDSNSKISVIAYAFFDGKVADELARLKSIYQDILTKKDTGQSQATRMSIRRKNELLGIMETIVSKKINPKDEALYGSILQLVEKILEGMDESHRLPSIRGVILLSSGQGELFYRLIEDFPMIVAGATYPYQWKHDNEVNIALLLANIDPYEAAQAVRFIVYHYMWRSQLAKEVGLYGWIPQIVFGNRQTGELPKFNNKTYHYFPDFRFRPTEKMDSEKERNRTSEIMQLPFFGWTVWRVYEELNGINKEHALSFLKEIYPYVRANTEAIRTALDPYDEAVLSGRDAWVNGMDNAWYHLIVMDRHLPERFIPKWAMEVVKQNRVDNRVDKKPGNPVDPKLAAGRPSEHYYASKIVFYDIIYDLGLDPRAVYHASPYNAKDVAITGVMARSLGAQIAMAKALQDANADVHGLNTLERFQIDRTKTWDEEINRYQAYLDRMKQVMNESFWSPEDKTYFNRDVTQMFPGVVEQLFCRTKVDDQGRISYEPRLEYWNYQSGEDRSRGYELNHKALESVPIDQNMVSITMDLNGEVHYEYRVQPQYWSTVKVEGGGIKSRLRVKNGDPFLAEQFCHIVKDESGNIWYEPNLEYWSWVENQNNGGNYELNSKARNLIGQGARRIEDGDLLRSPAIAGFFPIFGKIPNDEQAFEQALQVINPWMWWPVDGIPIPTQPMKIMGPGGMYTRNNVYDPDRYWLGPTWMASNKPVIDGFRSYGYEMMYLHIVHRTVGTLQDGRAVEHWRPETGEVNTSNVNFPWSASCMAGSIWDEMSKEQRNEYLRRFHSSGTSNIDARDKIQETVPIPNKERDVEPDIPIAA